MSYPRQYAGVWVPDEPNRTVTDHTGKPLNIKSLFDAILALRSAKFTVYFPADSRMGDFMHGIDDVRAARWWVFKRGIEWKRCQAWKDLREDRLVMEVYL